MVVGSLQRTANVSRQLPDLDLGACRVFSHRTRVEASFTGSVTGSLMMARMDQKGLLLMLS